MFTTDGNSDILPGITAFLNELREGGYRIALASASKNAGTVLTRLGLENAFDYVADAALARAILYTRVQRQAILSMKVDDKFDRKVYLGDILIKHTCYQCDETNFCEIKLAERAWWWSKYYVECPNCKTRNDI